jgi:acyl-CoA dehydrogenase
MSGAHTVQDDDLLADAVEHLLAQQATPAVVRSLEAGGSRAALWAAIEASGFCGALVPEAMGGAGLGLRDVLSILEACGRYALPVPLAQTMLARALIAQAGHPAPAGAIALHSGPSWQGAPLYADLADAVLLAEPGRLLLHAADRATAGAALLSFDSATDLRAAEALLLAAQMSGAMRALFQRTLQHANDRTQFGRAIGKFQAVQHQLSVMAEHVAAAGMAVRMACGTSHITADPLAAAVAKARTSQAVVLVTGIAHAVHGAIGITQEFDLQLLTRRLHAWRVAAGSESYWNARIGAALLASPHASLPDFVRNDLCPSN